MMAKRSDGESAAPTHVQLAWTLHHAAAVGSVDACKLLLAHGAVVDAVDTRGYTALCAAAKYGHDSVCEFLLSQGAQVNRAAVEGTHQLAPLAVALKGRNLAMCEWLLEHGADVHCGLPFDPLRREVTGMYDLLLRYSTKVTAGAMDRGSRMLRSTAIVGTVPLCRLLVSMGAGVNSCDEDGVTALHHAAEWALLPLCEFLVVEESANAAIRDTEARSPIFLAARRESIHRVDARPVCKLLVAYGAPIPTDTTLPGLPQAEDGYLAAIRNAGWSRRLPAFNAYIAVNGVWW